MLGPLRLSYVLLMLLVCYAQTALSQTASSEPSKAAAARTSLEVIDPFVEMHTGPGRGYPIFYVIEQGEKVELLTRRPDWYEVKAKGGRLGWVKASQIARTLQPTGEPVDLPSVSYGDFLRNSWRVGFSIGPFNSGELANVDVFTANAGYRPLSWLSFDLEFGNFYGTEVRGDLYNLNAVIEPISRWKASPFLLLGSGKMTIDSQPKLTPLNIDTSSYQLYGLGLNYYIGRSFVVRAEYRKYSLSLDKEEEDLESWKIGFNTFF